jgi:hypothetical protein
MRNESPAFLSGPSACPRAPHGVPGVPRRFQSSFKAFSKQFQSSFAPRFRLNTCHFPEENVKPHAREKNSQRWPTCTAQMGRQLAAKGRKEHERVRSTDPPVLGTPGSPIRHGSHPSSIRDPEYPVLRSVAAAGVHAPCSPLPASKRPARRCVPFHTRGAHNAAPDGKRRTPCAATTRDAPHDAPQWRHIARGGAHLARTRRMESPVP